MEPVKKDPASSRKLFFGLFVFPLLIAVGMAVLLCTVVLLTHEEQSPETLIASIKTGSPGKRWQKAYELSNELNKSRGTLRGESVSNEIIQILSDPSKYDAKTRSYMAIALSHFNHPSAVDALKKALGDADQDVKLYSLWSLGKLSASAASAAVARFLDNENPDLRKMAAYVLGAMADKSSAAALRAKLSDPVEDVRWNAALALARLGDNSGLKILLQMLDGSALEKSGLRGPESEAVKINAVKGLALVGDASTLTALEAVSKNDESLKVRQAAIDAIHFQKNRTPSERLNMERLNS